MIEVKNLSAGYQGTDILRNISFDMHSGANLCIVGPNGCGKTTLLKAISGILPMKGEVFIDGKNIKDLKRHEIARKIAVMSQISTVYFSYTVLETVLLGRYLYMKDNKIKEPSKEDKACAEKYLETVGMTELKDRQINTLSGGQLQKVFLARALAQEPDIILLDEPTNHLDLKSQKELITYLKEWTSDCNHSVIGVFHDLNHAIEIGDYLLVLDQGDVKAFGKPEEIMRNNLLNEVYGIDVTDYMINSLRRWEGRKGRSKNESFISIF